MNTPSESDAVYVYLFGIVIISAIVGLLALFASPYLVARHLRRELMVLGHVRPAERGGH